MHKPDFINFIFRVKTQLIFSLFFFVSLLSGSTGIADSFPLQQTNSANSGFADSAKLAAIDLAVSPEIVTQQLIPVDQMSSASEARRRLDLSQPSAKTSRAQAKFDCWRSKQKQDDHVSALESCERASKETWGGIIAQRNDFERNDLPLRVIARFTLYFSLGSAALNKTAQKVIENVIATHKSHGSSAIFISGHTDTTGSNTFNTILAEHRALAVADALLAGGVSATVIQILSFGEKKQQYPTPDDTLELKNRRVMIILVE